MEDLSKLIQNILDVAEPAQIFKSVYKNKKKGVSDRLLSLEKEFQSLSGRLAVDETSLGDAVREKLLDARTALGVLYDWTKAQIISEASSIASVGPDSKGAPKPDTNMSRPASDFQVTTKKGVCYLSGGVSDEIFSSYGGYLIGESGTPIDVILKLVDSKEDNPFSKREVDALTLLRSEPNNEGKQFKHLPVLVDSFLGDGRRGNILSGTQDCFDLLAVKEKYKDGVDPKHMVWMLSRLLSIVGYAHSRKLIHRNIKPSNVLVRPQDHNCLLLGWECSVMDPIKNGLKSYLSDEDFSAPEIAAKTYIPPARECDSQQDLMYLEAACSADIYSIGKCMIYILGGDLKTNEMPDSVPLQIKRFLETFVIDSPLQRSRDAWELYGVLRKIIVSIWGPRKFLEFKMS